MTSMPMLKMESQPISATGVPPDAMRYGRGSLPRSAFAPRTPSAIAGQIVSFEPATAGRETLRGGRPRDTDLDQ
jgi:hypothetical protein